MVAATQWEYKRLIEDVSGHADVQGALDEHMFNLIQAGGKEGWELVSAQPATRPNQRAINAPIPVVVLLFKREYREPKGEEQPKRPFSSSVGGYRNLPLVR